MNPTTGSPCSYNEPNKVDQYAYLFMLHKGEDKGFLWEWGLKSDDLVLNKTTSIWFMH